MAEQPSGEMRLNIAARHNNTVSSPSQTLTPLQQFLQHNSLRIAGIANLVGDVAFLGNGLKTSNPYKVMGGLLYTMGGLNLTFFGPVNKQRIMRDVSERTAEFIEHSNGHLPKDCALARMLQQKEHRPFATLDSVIHRKPAQNTLILYTAGAAALLSSGIHKYRHGEGSAGLFYGASSLAIKLGSLLIPEKHKHSNTEHHSTFSPTQWIKEKPLRLFGYGSLLTEGFLAWEAYQEHQRFPGKSNYLFTALSSGTYMLADLMMAISYKDPTNADGRFTHDERGRITELVAESIVQQPVLKHNKIIDNVAGFLAHQPEIRCDENELRQDLRTQVARMRTHNWQDRTEQESTQQVAQI